MRYSMLFLILLLSPLAKGFAPADDPYAPLRLYDGAWEVLPAKTEAGKSPDRLENQCAQIGKYFACQQTVNGKVSALIVFVPADKPGHYYNQAVMPEGWAGGRGELEIAGSRWVYSSKAQEKDKTTYYRTTNIFTGNDRIHYEQTESPDNEHWSVTGSGDEKRVAKGDASAK